jgi:hypothetical protein
LLSILRDFDDFNKHRLLKITFSAVAQGNIGMEGPSRHVKNIPKFIPNTGELKDGAEIAALVFASPAPDMEFDRKHFVIILAIWNRTRLKLSPYEQRTELVYFMDLLINETKQVVDIIINKLYLATSI